MNNNNRYNGFCLRGVAAFYLMIMQLTKEKLLCDLYVSYNKAKRHKSYKPYVIEFAKNLDANLIQLMNDLWNHTYIPEPFICFIIECPKKREVYAAAFRDRIVHHLYYEYTHKFFENTFIADTYSCIKGRGTSYGIERLRHHICSESENYSKICYALKIDIKGYFMHIDKNILYEYAMQTIHKYEKIKKYADMLDFDFIKYLTKELIFLDCTKNCINISSSKCYKNLPKSKLLAYMPSHCGLPIGNLTSQLFSNVYLNILDQYVKRVLKFKHYGRYVDDAYIISCDKEKLRKAIPMIENFIKDALHLELQKGKTRICNVKYGVGFLGAYIKPFRIYVSNQCLARMKRTLYNMTHDNMISKTKIIQSIISKIGYLSHYKSYNIRKALFYN